MTIPEAIKQIEDTTGATMVTITIEVSQHKHREPTVQFSSIWIVHLVAHSAEGDTLATLVDKICANSEKSMAEVEELIK